MKRLLHLAFFYGFICVSNAVSQNSLSWSSCGTLEGLECANTRVPLDWSDYQKGNISLSIIRLRAATQPSEGYMFYNPGGPGISGVAFVAQIGQELQDQLGSSWDILSWDPRGVGDSGPNITLFTDDADYDQFWQQTQGFGHLDARGNLTTQADVDFFMSQVPAYDSLRESFDSRHRQKNGDLLKYIGTCSVVRDLVALVDMIYGPTKDVNFYGYSYGTIIGTYLTQMFPERVGKVVLDGVYDPVIYANDLPMKGVSIDMGDTEKALAGWAENCAAAPDQCELSAAGNNTKFGVLLVYDEIIDNIYRNYDGSVWSYSELANASIIESFTATPRKWSWQKVVENVHQGLYSSDQWTTLGTFLQDLYQAQNNITSSLSRRSTHALIPKSRFINYSPVGSSGVYASFALDAVTPAIVCGDSRDPDGSTTTDLFNEIVNASRHISPHFASAMLYGLRTACHKWTSRAIERLPEPMNKKPKNVVLVIGNTADPITPFASAQKIASSAHLGDMARLVKFNATGHCSLAMNSNCIDNTLKAYVRGDLPEDAGNDDADVECHDATRRAPASP